MDVVNSEQVSKLHPLSDTVKLNSIRPALPRRLGLPQLWHWSVYRQTSVARAGFLEWYAFPSLEHLFPCTEIGTTERPRDDQVHRGRCNDPRHGKDPNRPFR